MKISDLMERIRLHEIALPEFQREYVWDVEQARQLLESLYRGYPTGSLLLWDTTTPPATKSSGEALQFAGQRQIILDGQQRLTALYVLTRGEPPPYYGLHEIAHDPRSLQFNLVTGDFRAQTSATPASPEWVAVHTCFSNELEPIRIAQAITGLRTGEAVNKLIEQCVTNSQRLRSITEYNYAVQSVPISATLDEAIDVFDRINSSGTKLTPAELALTHITGKWPEARHTMKTLLAELEARHFHFDLDFLVCGLAGMVSGQVHYGELHYLPAATIQSGWERLAAALTSMVELLPAHAGIASTEYLPSVDALVPLALYLDRHNGAFPSAQARSRALYWLYAATIWGRYTNETAQRLAYDLSIVRRSDEPWSELVDAIVEQRGRVEVRASDLEGRGPEHPLYGMALIAMAVMGATDWKTSVPLAGVPHIHSYPLFALPASPNTDDEALRRKQADEIANQVFLISEPHPALLHQLPALAQHSPSVLEQHCVPLDAALWQAQHIDAFLSTRREHIAAAINARMQFFQAAFVQTKPIHTIADLIAAGESIGVEFKSTLRYSVKDRVKKLELEQEVAKSIAAFLNAEGGIIVIGVQDDGSIFGIEEDLALVQHKNIDGFELALRTLVKDRMGPEYNGYVRTHFTKVKDKQVCVLRVYRSPRPVFCTPPQQGADNRFSFFVRTGNLSQTLTPAQVNSYIALHWGA